MLIKGQAPFSPHKKNPRWAGMGIKEVYLDLITIVPQQPVNYCRLSDFMILNLTTFSNKKAPHFIKVGVS